MNESFLIIIQSKSQQHREVNRKINKIQYQIFQRYRIINPNQQKPSIDLLLSLFELFRQVFSSDQFSYKLPAISLSTHLFDHHLQMGNQESLMYKNAVYEDQGKYIVPTKIRPPEQTQEAQIIKNIFGVNDPTLLTRSYWAKDSHFKNNSLDRKLQRSPTKSRRLKESSVGVNSRHHAVDWAQQQNTRPERQILGRSIVSNFRQDLKETPSRNLSKITSCSIISKLNQFEADLQSTSPLRNFEKPSITNIFSQKNKQNSSNQLSGSQIPSSNRIRKTQGVDGSTLLKSRIDQNRQSQVKDQMRSQVSKIFGFSNVSNQEEQRVEQNFKPSKNGKKQEINNHQRCSQQNRHQNNLNHHNNSVGINHELCEQTFSRFEQNPALLCSSLQDKASQKSNNFDILSKKTHSKHSEIQKFDGLNEDSKNESLMKVLKRITQISIDNSIPPNKSSKQIKSNQIQQNISQILNENVHQRFQVASKQSQKSKALKSESTQKYQEPPFEFYLHQVKNTASQKSSNNEKSISNKSSSNFSQNQRNPIYSEAAKANSKSLSKFSNHHLTENYEKNCNFRQNRNQNVFEYLDNEESHETQQKIENSNDDFFKCSKMKSPKSITSEQVGLTRQRSCAGRIVQTSKAADNKEYSSPFKSKKYDFSKKQVSKNEKSSSKYDQGKRETSNRQSSPSEIYYAQVQKRSPSQKSPSRKSPSHKSSSKTLDYQLMMKIQTLEGELKSLKRKEDLEKFQSRRYSPVKQEKFRKKAPLNEQEVSVEQNEQEDSKYCINELSKCTPFKRRAQYFKLKLK